MPTKRDRWAQYYVAATAGLMITAKQAANHADEMLAEEKKRFGPFEGEKEHGWEKSDV